MDLVQEKEPWWERVLPHSFALPSNHSLHVIEFDEVFLAPT